MRNKFPLIVFCCAAVLLGGCRDETLSAYGAADKVWLLQSLNEADFKARATLVFPEEGAIKGSAPCNDYSASQTVPYPWFKAEEVLSTKRACPELELEQAFFDALSTMTLSEVGPDLLILSNDEGQQMIFQPE